MTSAETLVPARFRPWIKLATRLGFTDFVGAEDGFASCLGSAERWTNRDACGIYFWIADDGETYVGQTVNARDRLRAHWRDYPDLSYAGFQAVPRDQLDARERALIGQVCEAGFPTRNIKHALQTERYVAFDRFVEDDARAAFLHGGVLPDSAWRELPILAQKQARKFARFERIAGADAVSHSLGLFLERVIPRPAATEARFWSVSLFVQSHILRVNAGQQEVFTVGRSADHELYVRPLSLAPSGPSSEGPLYATASFDAWMPAHDLSDWLSGRNLLSCRQLAVRLMRHTTTLNSGSHCPQVVRAATL